MWQRIAIYGNLFILTLYDIEMQASDMCIRDAESCVQDQRVFDKMIVLHDFISITNHSFILHVTAAKIPQDRKDVVSKRVHILVVE